MSDLIKEYWALHGSGSIELRIPLKGSIELGTGPSKSSELVLSGSELYLVATSSTEHGKIAKLLDDTSVRYQRRTLGDRVAVGSTTFTVPTGRGEDALRAFALARLRRRAVGQVPRVVASRYVDELDEVERTFFAGRLAREELALIWLPARTTLPVPSTLLGDAELPAHFLVTDRKCLLVSLNAAGDFAERPIPNGPLKVRKNRRAVRVERGSVVWEMPLGEFDRIAEVAEVTGSLGHERIFELARLAWLHRDPRHGAFSQAAVLTRLARERGHPLAPFAQFLQAAELEDPPPVDTLELERAALTLAETKPRPEVLADLWQSLGCSVDAGMRLVLSLREQARPLTDAALALHERLHRSRPKSEPPKAAAAADIELAAHWIDRGKGEAARVLLHSRLEKLPTDALEALLPAPDTDLTTQGGGPALRVRLHELIALTSPRDAPDPAPLAELARLQPLVPARIQALIEVATGSLEQRARRVERVLSPGGLANDQSADASDGAVSQEPSSRSAESQKLSSEALEVPLKHPFSRPDNTLGKLQSVMALVPQPDHSLLREYCERLEPERRPAAARALSEAATILGLAGVEAYVSRGTKSVGIRAYGGTPAFVLIGWRHLDHDADFRMSESEFRFALGSELAHVRFNHTRVTSSEVWAGALTMTRDGLTLALGVLPALRGWKVADRLGDIANKLPRESLDRWLNTLGAVAETVRQERRTLEAPLEHEESVISRVNEELVAAHRAMQLTADRAGLVVARDLAAAFRSILLMRRDYRELLMQSESEGLGVLLGRRDAQGRVAHQDLALRVASLIAFYLSDDYERLSASAWTNGDRLTPAPA